MKSTYVSLRVTLFLTRGTLPPENFWPIYSEDCDYWLRALLVGCRVFYRGGYIQEQEPKALVNAFVDHGDVKDSAVKGSATFKSNPILGKLVEGTLHPTRGRFAYLIRKWGSEACGYYHEVLNAWRDEDAVLDPPGEEELKDHNAVIKHPYNDPVGFADIRTWLRDDWTKPQAVSPRSVNAEFAPTLVPEEFVWEAADFAKLDALS